MRVSTTLGALLACIGFLTGSALAADSPTGLLREAMTAPQRVSYVGEMQMLRFGNNKSEASIYRIEHRAPNLTRRWYLAPQDLYGDSIISRGEDAYSIDVQRNRIVVTHDDAIDDQVAEDDNFALLMRNYRAVFGPDEMVDGRPVRVVLLTNKYTGETTMRLHIDVQTKLVLEKEQFASNGSIVTQTRFEHVRYTNQIPPAIFDIPKNMSVVTGASRGLPSSNLQRLVTTAGFNARGPRYLPDGFVPVAGDVIDIKGIRTLHLLYSDGIRTVSLFENAKGAAVDLTGYHAKPTRVENHDANYVEEGPTTLLAWFESGLHFALVGELGRDELEKIADSVVP